MLRVAFHRWSWVLFLIGLPATGCGEHRSSASKRGDERVTCETVAPPAILAQAAVGVTDAVNGHASLAAFRALVEAHADDFVQARTLDYGTYAWDATQWTFVSAQDARRVALAFPGDVVATGEYSGAGFRLTIDGLPDPYEYVVSQGSTIEDPRESSVTLGQFAYADFRQLAASSVRRSRHATPWGFNAVEDVRGTAADAKTQTMRLSLGGDAFALAVTQHSSTATSDGFLRWNDRVYQWTGEPKDYCAGTVAAFLALHPDVFRLLVPGDDEVGPLWLKAFPEPWF